MEYLLNDQKDFYDTNFVSRLEHQVKTLKRLISLQVAQLSETRVNKESKGDDKN